jgi:DNA polymerase III sliding clamp (beta) subunit (PCNA family)
MTHDVTVPAGILASLLRQTGEVSIGIDGEQLLIMPDEHSQYRAVLFGLKYPNIARAMERVLPNEFRCKKTHILDILNRASSFSDSNRDPMLRCFIGKEEFAVMMSNEETGLLGDILDLPGQAIHDRLEIFFTPKNLLEPITNAPSEEVVIAYDASNAQAPVRVDGGSGYFAWAMPRKKMEAQQ